MFRLKQSSDFSVPQVGKPMSRYILEEFQRTKAAESLFSRNENGIGIRALLTHGGCQNTQGCDRI